MILSDSQKSLVQDALAPLVGLPISDMWRYAGCQKFEFGEQRPHLNRKGDETTWADWGLVVSCAWRIEGPNCFILSSDHFGETRTDDFAHDFYDSLEDAAPVVEGVDVQNDGGFCLTLSKGYALDVQPDADVDPEYDRWRFMPPDGDPRGHLVMEGASLGWSG